MTKNKTHKFLYLNERAHAITWVRGGMVPVSLASKYQREERSGIYTPDETLIHKSEIPIPALEDIGISLSEVKGFSVTNTIVNGERFPDIVDADYYHEDGRIICFSNLCHPDVAKGLDYKKACVRIVDIDLLKLRLENQLGCKITAGNCSYTEDHQRNHFLKSVEDKWQDEYRFFIPRTDVEEVKIPRGTAKLVATYNY